MFMLASCTLYIFLRPMTHVLVPDNLTRCCQRHMTWPSADLQSPSLSALNARLMSRIRCNIAVCLYLLSESWDCQLVGYAFKASLIIILPTFFYSVTPTSKTSDASCVLHFDKLHQVLDLYPKCLPFFCKFPFLASSFFKIWCLISLDVCEEVCDLIYRWNSVYFEFLFFKIFHWSRKCKKIICLWSLLSVVFWAENGLMRCPGC